MNTDLRQFRESTRSGHRVASPLDAVEGFLNADLDAASNPLTGSTTAELRVIEWQDAETFYETGQTITLRNRSPAFSANEGAYVMAMFVGGEWRPIAGACG